jgi:DNA-binding transcriptional regulator PaaX
MKKDTQNIELEDEGKNSETIKEKIENFFDSDSMPATAAKFTLAILALGTVAFVGAAVPGLIALAEKPRYHRSYSKKQMRDAVYQLKKKKLIEIILEGDITKVRLTNKGADRVKEFCLEFLEIKKPKKWDKKWRVLIFDIPSKPKIYNLAREALRKKIKDLGFQQLQKSVWVYPYECEDEILFVAEIYQVQKFIEILTVEKLLHENILRTKFKL